MRLAQEDGVLDRDADIDVLIDMMEGGVMQHLLLHDELLDATEITAYLRRLLRQAGFSQRAGHQSDESSRGSRTP